MRKIATFTLLAMILMGSTIKTASAQIVLDPGQLGGKVSDFVQKIQDAAGKITQQINQIKMAASQGFSLGDLADLKGKFYNIATGFLSDKISKLVSGTSEKEQAALQADVDTYKETRTQLFDAKIEETNASIEKMETESDTKKSEAKAKENECARLRDEANSETDIALQSEKKGAVYKCQMELSRINTEISDLEQGKRNMKKQKTELKKQRSIVGTDEDEGYKQRVARVEALKEAAKKEEDGFIAAAEHSGGDKEWDSEEATKDIDFDAVAKSFVEKYFYDPENLKGTTTVNYQSNLDRIYRERRYLFVNTAAHLLQVATSIRREIPERTMAIDAYANESAAGANETTAMASYAATRVETIKALVLYAKLLSVKLQYLATRDLLQADSKKEYIDKNTGQIKNFGDFDLEKYIVDEDYINAILEDANTGVLNDEAMDTLNPAKNKNLVNFSTDKSSDD